MDPWCTHCDPEIAPIGMRQLATILLTYPTQSDAIRMAALAYMNGQPTSL
ncbi:MAG: hypothetical protein ABSH33_06740 [Steroidobacteraceae bacterium]|jgi:hypothetical protein